VICDPEDPIPVLLHDSFEGAGISVQAEPNRFFLMKIFLPIVTTEEKEVLSRHRILLRLCFLINNVCARRRLKGKEVRWNRGILLNLLKSVFGTIFIAIDDD